MSLHFAKMRLIASVCVLGLLVFVLGQGESKKVQLPEEVKEAVKEDEEAKPDEELAKIPDIAKSYWSHCKYIFEAYLPKGVYSYFSAYVGSGPASD